MRKKIRNVFVAVAIIATSSAIVIACSDANDSQDSVSLNTKSLNVQPYLTQIPFITGGDSSADADFLVDYSIYEKVANSNVDWTYFDNLYNSSLQNSIKQELSYDVLCKKDLIGLLNNDLSNATLAAALKKHVDNLVDTQYLGYTSLYYALDALKSTGKETVYVKTKAAEIVQYAANDPFHPDMIQAGAAEVGSQVLYDQIVDNYDYVSKIANLQ